MLLLVEILPQYSKKYNKCVMWEFYSLAVPAKTLITSPYASVEAVEFLQKERLSFFFLFYLIVRKTYLNVAIVCDLMVIIHPEWTAMENYKPDLSCQSKFIPIDFSKQIIPGTFESALSHIVDNHLDLTAFDDWYQNDQGGAAFLRQCC